MPSCSSGLGFSLFSSVCLVAATAFFVRGCINEFARLLSTGTGNNVQLLAASQAQASSSGYIDTVHNNYRYPYQYWYWKL
jgi:hypothetical protein